MSAPDQPVPASTPPEEAPWCSEEDNFAAFESAYWYATSAAELTEQYRGMHVAVLDKQIIDADRDFDALGLRLEAKRDTIAFNRIVFRYVPTEEEAIRFRF